MNSTSSESSIEIDNVTYQLRSLDEFGFEANVDLARGLRSKGLLTLGEDKLGVAFRVRENKDGTTKCSFSNLSIAGSEVIQKYLRKRQRGFIEGSLESRSYDELAKGLTGAASAYVPQASIPETTHTTHSSASTTNNGVTANSNGAETKNAQDKWSLPKPHAFDSAHKKSDQLAAASSAKTAAAHTTVSKTSANTTITSQTIDQSTPLAPRQTTSRPATTAPATPANVSASNITSNDSSLADDSFSNAKTGVRSLALLLMMFALVGLVIVAFYFLRSRSTLSVGNSALVGNYLPVNVKAEGEIIELLVSEGDTVKKGDLLMRLRNPEMQMEQEQFAAKLETAKSKVTALRKQLKNTEKRIAIAGKKLALDLIVAKSEMKSAGRFYEVAMINFERLKPALESGAITESEFEVVRQELLAAEANKMTTENVVKQIEFAQASIKDNILIMGDRFDDEIGRMITELEIAEAEQKEMKMALTVANEQFENLNVTAPRDGTVYVTYRQVGEFVKVADQTVGLSFEGKVWAAGQVSSSQSRRVRPGQPVTVTAPSLGKTFDGVVSAVGHRAMYSNGHYTADFRGETATDVPIKVIIQDLPENVPSGIRLEMAINTGFGVGWLDRTMGYSLRSISDGQPIDKEPKPETAPEDSNVEEELVGEVAVDM